MDYREEKTENPKDANIPNSRSNLGSVSVCFFDVLSFEIIRV